MNDKESFLKVIENKFILFDTGIIIRAFEHPDEFEKFFLILKEKECKPVFFSFINFEFTRGIYELKHREEREKFLSTICWGGKIPFQEDSLIEEAIKIANVYAKHKIYNPSITDCCIAAFLKKYEKTLLFVTLNHKDFPTFLFDRLHIYAIDTEKDIFPLAFYKYNSEKGKKAGMNNP